MLSHVWVDPRPWNHVNWALTIFASLRCPRSRKIFTLKSYLFINSFPSGWALWFLTLVTFLTFADRSRPAKVIRRSHIIDLLILETVTTRHTRPCNEWSLQYFHLKIVSDHSCCQFPHFFLTTIFHFLLMSAYDLFLTQRVVFIESSANMISDRLWCFTFRDLSIFFHRVYFKNRIAPCLNSLKGDCPLYCLALSNFELFCNSWHPQVFLTLAKDWQKMLVPWTYVIFKAKYIRFSKKFWKLKIFQFFSFIRTEDKKPSDTALLQE